MEQGPAWVGRERNAQPAVVRDAAAAEGGPVQ